MDLFTKCGYLPFSLDEENTFIYFVYVGDEECPVYKMDHEIAYDICTDIINLNELNEQMQLVAEDFISYLNDILENKKQNIKIE